MQNKTTFKKKTTGGGNGSKKNFQNEIASKIFREISKFHFFSDFPRFVKHTIKHTY